MVWFKYNYKNWMHSFEVSLGYESVDRTTSMWPLHNQSYCNISMKNGSNVIIKKHITRNGYKQPNNRLHSQTATLSALKPPPGSLSNKAR
jgi:hypothetical protein